MTIHDNENRRASWDIVYYGHKCAISCTLILKCNIGIKLCTIGSHLSTIYTVLDWINTFVSHIIPLYCLIYVYVYTCFGRFWMDGTVMFVELCCVSISRGGDDMWPLVNWIVRKSLDFEREVCYHNKSSMNIDKTLNINKNHVYKSKEILTYLHHPFKIILL